MAQNRYKRKLTAILSADVVGYSRLMGDDEEFTIQTLNSYRDLMTALIEQYSGSVVDAVGDNLLAEFTSAADAVQCAAAIQIKLKKQNENLSDSRRMHFRIGINIGDIVHENSRIYGDGVNIAARIESLADPGGISISRNIYNHIKKQLDFEYDYMGEHSVKNISDPVKVYKVITGPKDAKNISKQKSGHTAKKSKLKKWLTITASILLILIAVLAGLYWKYFYLPAPADIDPEGDIEFNLPEGPSIAVLPFVNMSKDPEQEYFCDGITENIISSLAQMPQLLVIARNSTFAYKDKAINVQQIGRELNARYIIEGSIQKSNKSFRITVQLIDTDSGHHIWSESYNRVFKDILKLQDEITLEILKAMNINITISENTESFLEGITDIKSVIIVAKLVDYALNPTKNRYGWALKNVKRIIASNPAFIHRYDLLALVYITGAMNGSCKSDVTCILEATNAIKKSFALNTDNWLAHQMSGSIWVLKRELEKAIPALKKAIELNPNNDSAYFAMGWALNISNKPEEALEYLNKAIRLNPVASLIYLFNFGWAYYLLDEYEKAIHMLKKCLVVEPNYYGTYGLMAINYIRLGQEDNARASVRQLLDLFPDYSIEHVKKNSLSLTQERLNRAIKDYRKAGLPETSQ